MFACLLAYGVLSGAQGTKSFRDEDLGLIFQYPASWASKKDKYSTTFTFPTADGASAQLQIFKLQFRQEKPVFQQLQREVADQMKRRVSRQWEEQVLGVPLLLTRIEFAEGGKEMSTLVGLFYTATREKLNFRLTSTAGTVQEAENAWRGTLNSLRTVNDELPVPEDPTKPLPNPDKTPDGKPITRLTPDTPNGEPVRTKNVHRLERLGQKLDLYLPEGWTLEPVEERTLLRHEKLVGTVELSFTSGGRQQTGEVLQEAANESFEKFGLVSLRDDPVPGVRKSGTYVASTLRVGKSAQGSELVLWHIVGAGGSVMWRLDYSAGSQSDYKADRKLIERLMDYTAVEIAP